MSDKDNNLLKSDILTVGNELSEKLNAIGVPNTFGKASEGKDNLVSIIRMTINGIDMIIEQIREKLKDYYNKSEVNTLLNGKSDTSHNHNSAYANISHNHDSAYASKSHQHDGVYANISHNHNSAYASKNHNHDNAYANISHNHDSTYANISHNHDNAYVSKSKLKDYYNKSEVNTLLNGKSDTSHNHDNAYASINHNHDDDYSDINHNHDNAYANISHNHDNAYASINHNHTTANVTEASALSHIGTSANASQHTINESIDNIIGNLTGAEIIKVVTALPSASASTMNALYLLSSNSQYDIYITIENSGLYSWEKLDDDVLSDLSIAWGDITGKPTNFTPTRHSSTANTYGIGTDNKYGHNKVIDNLNQSENHDGYSLSAHQGYVLNQNKADKSSIDTLESDITSLNNSITNHTTTFTDMIEIHTWSIPAFSLGSGNGVEKKVTVPNPSGYYRVPIIQGAYKCYASSMSLSGTTLTVKIQNHYSTNANASMYGVILYFKSSIIKEI